MALNSSQSVFWPLRSVIYVTKHTVLLKLYDLKIESFFFFCSLDSSFFIKKPFNKEKKTFWFVFIISCYWY